jgi:rare lipoprotein A
MYKLWFGLTTILVTATAQSWHVAAAADRNLPVPQVQPLPTVQKAAPAQLRRLQKLALVIRAQPIQPLLLAEKPMANSWSYLYSGKYSLIQLPRNFIVAQNQPSQPVVKPLPVLQNTAPRTSLDDPETTPDPASAPVKILDTQTGGASWYGPEGGPLTATGERYIPSKLTAAHRKLPFGTKVQVTNLRNNQSVIVRINDRGPFVGGRIIDLSDAAAAEIGIKSSGVGRVRLDILSYGDGRRVRR